MKNNIRGSFALTLASAWLSSYTAFAGTPTSLSLDFQPTGGTTQAGFEAFEATNQVLPVGGTAYSAFGLDNITVSLTTANLPDGNLDFRAVTRNGTAGEKENDWLGVDTRGTAGPGVDVTMTVSIAGLPAGLYSWISTHHDGGSGATNGNLIGTPDYEFIDGNGSTGIIANGLTISSQNLGNPISTFNRIFTANGTDPISLSLIMDNAQGGTTSNALFALMNSVEITVVPEPSAIALLGFGLAGLMVWRRCK